MSFDVDSVGKPLLSPNLYHYTGNNPINFIDPFGLFGITVGFEGTAAAFGFYGTGGIYGNYAHDSSKPWYQGWSSSATVVLGGGAAGSVKYLGGGVHVSGNNSCSVDQLNDAFLNGGRTGLGPLSVGGYRSPDGNVTGVGITIGPSLPNTYMFGSAGGTNTWTLGGGNW